MLLRQNFVTTSDYKSNLGNSDVVIVLYLRHIQYISLYIASHYGLNVILNPYKGSVKLKRNWV